jgi:uncharacterized membrane protein required for colicin V production
VPCYVRDVTLMLASLDTTPAQFTVDLLLVALVGVNAYLGWRYGMLRRLVGFAGLYLGCLAATNVGNAVAAALHSGSVFVNAWSFVAVLVVVVVTFEVLGFLFNDKIQRIAVVLFDRIAGVIAGVLVGLAQALVLFLVAYALANTSGSSPGATHDRASAADAIQSATLAGQAVRITPEVHSIFGPVLPSDLSAHLAEGTPVVTPKL